jgi:hypothetical protein
MRRAKSAWGVGFVKATRRQAARQGVSNLHILPREGLDSAMPKSKSAKRPKPAVAEMSTGEATAATLIAHGLDTVYALPGVHNDHLFDAFQRAGSAACCCFATFTKTSRYREGLGLADQGSLTDPFSDRASRRRSENRHNPTCPDTNCLAL